MQGKSRAMRHAASSAGRGEQHDHNAQQDGPGEECNGQLSERVGTSAPSQGEAASRAAAQHGAPQLGSGAAPSMTAHCEGRSTVPQRQRQQQRQQQQRQQLAPTCMQLKRTKWCSLVFFTTDRNMTKKMMSGANWLPK